ncbi:MAG: tetratricopeptide repeat protein [Desulfuromonadaceae bacterium]|nr:tetratricopeptide repeat protein [Desulfuromonadaceae bacterium]
MRFSSAVILILCGLLVGCAEPQKSSSQQEDVHYILGVSYLQEGDASRALQEFHMAHKADAHSVDILVGLGRAYQLKGAFAEAEGYYLRALQLRPDDSLIENNLGDLYLNMQRLDDAIHYFGKAASNLMFTSSEVSFTGLGYANFQKREYLEATNAYRKALRQNPRYDEAHLRLGETYYAMGKTDRALGEFQQALKLNGNNIRTHFQLGLAHMKADSPTEAVQYFRNVLKLSPSSELAEQAEHYLELLQ